MDSAAEILQRSEKLVKANRERELEELLRELDTFPFVESNKAARSIQSLIEQKDAAERVKREVLYRCMDFVKENLGQSQIATQMVAELGTYLDTDEDDSVKMKTSRVVC